jgi:hypothetical protein
MMGHTGLMRRQTLLSGTYLQYELAQTYYATIEYHYVVQIVVVFLGLVD